MQLEDADLERHFLFFSLRPVAEIHELLHEHATAPEKRRAQRALADELTALVHGESAAGAAAEAADVLFGGDPLTASQPALEMLAGEVPSSRVTITELEDTVGLLAATGLATSRSDARRLLEQGSVRANGAVLRVATGLTGVELLHGRYLLLRKGKRSYHLVEVFSPAG
jgi:tyrosyl-tRNA synthetase